MKKCKQGILWTFLVLVNERKCHTHCLNFYACSLHDIPTCEIYTAYALAIFMIFSVYSSILFLIDISTDWTWHFDLERLRNLVSTNTFINYYLAIENVSYGIDLHNLLKKILFQITLWAMQYAIIIIIQWKQLCTQLYDHKFECAHKCVLSFGL